MLAANTNAVEIARAVRAGATSAVAVTEAALARIDARDPDLNCFTTVTRARALAEAALVDAACAAGRDPGPLAGVPYAVKDLFDVAGVVTLAGSKINAGRPPAARDAVLIQRLRAAGAVLVGALNMDEYAYGFTTENPHYGTTRNPHDHSRIAGGSSGGSAAAVAAGLVPLTLGSDTNGSIRVPSSLCGVFGLKPTYGRLPRSGTFPFVASLDHVGPFARSSADLALCYDLMQGVDSSDLACAARVVEPCTPTLHAGVGGLRMAVLEGYFAEGLADEAVAAVADAARALGITARMNLPEVARARAAAYVITACEAANLHREALRTRPDEFSALVRDRLLAGALAPAEWYLQAQRVRRWFAERVARVFSEVDVLIAPSTPACATPIGQDVLVLGGRAVPLRPNLGLFTQPISCIGLPVVAVPIERPGRLPLGIQVIAAPWREDLCLRVAAALEASGVARAPVADLVEP